MRILKLSKKLEENKMNIDELSKILYLCYSKELCYPKIKENWNKNNKYFGMCAITSLVVNDYFGGKICKIYVDGISHYFNFLYIIILRFHVFFSQLSSVSFLLSE